MGSSLFASIEGDNTRLYAPLYLTKKKGGKPERRANLLMSILPKVHIGDSQKDLPIKKRLITQIVKDLLKFLEVDCKEISIYFVTRKKMSSLHEQFFQDPSPTDCISFPLDHEHLGEVFVCPSVAIAYAKEKRLNPFEETILYIVHGILHLIGYDDLTPNDKKTMRRMEKKCMERIRSEIDLCS